MQNTCTIFVLVLVSLNVLEGSIIAPAPTPCLGTSSIPFVITNSSGTIVNSLAKYTTLGVSCGWLITPNRTASDEYIYLDFGFVVIGASDYISVYNGTDVFAPLLGVMSNTQQMTFNTTGDSFYISFTTALFGEL